MHSRFFAQCRQPFVAANIGVARGAVGAPATPQGGEKKILGVIYGENL